MIEANLALLFDRAITYCASSKGSGKTADVCLVWFFMSQSTAMVMSGRPVHLATLISWASLTKRLTSTLCTYFGLKMTTTLLESAEGRRMAVDIIS